MYLAGVSVRRVEDITEALWGTQMSPGTISNLNKKVCTAKSKRGENSPIEEEFPYVYLDGIVLKRSWAGELNSVSVLMAIGVNAEGYRKILGVCEGAKEDKAGWSSFLRHLKKRGLDVDSLSLVPVWAWLNRWPNSIREQNGSAAVYIFTAMSSA